jgi:hypothetical protein
VCLSVYVCCASKKYMHKNCHGHASFQMSILIVGDNKGMGVIMNLLTERLLN